MREAWGVLPFALLVPVLRYVPLPPYSMVPLPWGVAVAHAALFLVAFTAYVVCYARWQPSAPGRILLNEALARLWFAVYGALIVGLATPLGFHFLLMAVPWAALCWEVHRQEVRKAGYAAGWNLANWGLFLLGLSLLELAAVAFASP